MIKVVPVKFSETQGYKAPSMQRSHFRRNGLGVTVLASVNGRGAYEQRARNDMDPELFNQPIGVPSKTSMVPNKYGKKRYKRAKKKVAKLTRGRRSVSRAKKLAAAKKALAAARLRRARLLAAAKRRKKTRKKLYKPVAKKLGYTFKEFMRAFKSGLPLTPKQQAAAVSAAKEAASSVAPVIPDLELTRRQQVAAAEAAVEAVAQTASGSRSRSRKGKASEGQEALTLQPNMRRNTGENMESVDLSSLGAYTPNRRRRRRYRHNGDDVAMAFQANGKKKKKRKAIRKAWGKAKNWLDPVYIFAAQGIDASTTMSPAQKLEAYKQLQKGHFPKQTGKRKVTEKVLVKYGPLPGDQKKVKVTFDAKVPTAFGPFPRFVKKGGRLTYLEKGKKKKDRKKIPEWAIAGAPTEDFYNQHPDLFKDVRDAIQAARVQRSGELQKSADAMAAAVSKVLQEGDMYTPNRRKKSKRRGKGRRKLYGAALAAYNKKRGGTTARRGRRRKAKRKGRGRRKLFGAALAAYNKKRGRKSRRRGSYRRNGTYSMNGMYSMNGFEGVVPSIMFAAQGFGGFFVHRFLTGIASNAFQSTSLTGKAAVSVAVAAVGIAGTYKFLRGEAAEAVSAGMGISAAYHVAQALLGDTVNQYLGEIPTERIGSLGEYYTRGVQGLGEYYTRGVQGLGEYYTQPAAYSGLGEYAEAAAGFGAYQQAAVGGPMQAAAGFGEYEVQTDGGVVLDGIQGSNAAVEAALNAADAMSEPMQAVAGLGDAEMTVEGRYIPTFLRPKFRGEFTDDPLRSMGVPPEYTEESGVAELDTWNPTDEQLIVNPARVGGSIVEANADF